jgi:hypothetical protein
MLRGQPLCYAASLYHCPRLALPYFFPVARQMTSLAGEHGLAPEAKFLLLTITLYKRRLLGAAVGISPHSLSIPDTIADTSQPIFYITIGLDKGYYLPVGYIGRI